MAHVERPKQLSKNKIYELEKKRRKRNERLAQSAVVAAGALAIATGIVYGSRGSEEPQQETPVFTPTAVIEDNLNSLKSRHIQDLNLFPSAKEKELWTITWNKAESDINNAETLPPETKVLSLIDITIGQMIASENEKYKAAGKFLDSHKNQIVYWASPSKDQLPPPDGQVFNIVPFVGETAPGETRLFYAIEYAQDKAADDLGGELVGLKGADALVNASAMISQVELYLSKPQFASYSPLQQASALDNWLNNPETGNEETAKLHAAALAAEIEASLIQSALLAPNVPVEHHQLTEKYLKVLNSSRVSNDNFAEEWLRVVKEEYLTPPNGETV